MHDKSFKRRGHTCRLRTACRAVPLVAIALFCTLQRTSAQQRPGGLLMDSVDPAADSIFISRLRGRLAAVRKEQKRPTVAVVLSGGGAKGSAQVGALKVIEETGIPIDLIGGTSIGGLIGGLYSLGYRADFIRNLFITSDWGRTLTDRIDQDYFTYRKKQYDSKYLISIPLVRHFREDETNGTERGLTALTKSLPEGYAFGFNVNNLLSSLSVKYHDDLDFSELPIPFYCVASDMVSCKEKNWGKGSLVTAMRSTMSIPGLFNPVREDSMVLVDGGTRNNFPIDLARAAGADYIIGIDLSDDDPGYNEVSHLGNILSQFITMLGQPSYDRNKDEADILIKPALKGYNMLSFTPEAVDTMYIRGLRAAQDKVGELMALKSRMNGRSMTQASPKAMDIRHGKVSVGDISFTGITEKEAGYLIKEFQMKGNSMMDATTMEDLMSKMLATGSLSSVKYRLTGSEEPFGLIFDCEKAPIHRVGLGFRGDTKEAVSLLLNIGINENKIAGSKLEVNAKLGSSQSGKVTYSYESLKLPTINVEADIANYNISRLFTGQSEDITRNDVSLWTHSQKVYLSSTKLRRFNILGGISNDFYGVKSVLSDEIIYAKEYLQENFRGDYLSLFFRGSAYSMDDRYFPHSGLYYNVRFNYEFAQLSGKTKGDFRPYYIFATDFKTVFPMGERLALLGDLHIRGVFGENSSHLGISNYVGGAVTGRYFEQQIPFVGFDDVCLCYDNVAVLNMDLRYNMFRKFYLSLQAGYLKEQNLLTIHGNLDLRPSNYGTALEAAYDSPLGPLKAALRWSNNRGWGVYMSLGFDF